MVGGIGDFRFGGVFHGFHHETNEAAGFGNDEGVKFERRFGGLATKCLAGPDVEPLKDPPLGADSFTGAARVIGHGGLRRIFQQTFELIHLPVQHDKQLVMPLRIRVGSPENFMNDPDRRKCVPDLVQRLRWNDQSLRRLFSGISRVIHQWDQWLKPCAVIKDIMARPGAGKTGVGVEKALRDTSFEAEEETLCRDWDRDRGAS
ncbi:hypothetical protein HQ447_06880 [bacterium]|nr:hypothetical protein [bacterium]